MAPWASRLAALALIGLLASCGRIIPAPQGQPSVPAVKPTTALAAGLSAGPAIASLGLAGDDAAGALASFP